jgi:tetratricopeptide (TPR) repeat protein
VDLKGLYKDQAKLEVVETILEDLKRKLEAESTSASDSQPISPPTMLLWLYYYLALHLAHPAHTTPDYARSLKLLETALEHTPTLPEIHMAKAMVLKRAGDPDGAARAMEQARLLDGQDRFLNGKAGKYWLRAGEVEKASAVFGLFTKVCRFSDTRLQILITAGSDCYRRMPLRLGKI